MTWASILATGSGRIVGYRLTVEGWPDVWVSDSRITYTGNLDGRTVRVGLKTEGLGFSEALNLHEARTIVRGFTAKVVSTTNQDFATASFSTFNRPVSFLQAALTDTDTTISASPSLSNSTYYHIGTETIYHSSGGTITRKHWNTHAQGHPGGATGHYGEPIQMPIYDKPPTMEGRRANLFVYAEGDSMSGDGTIVFRGIVSRPPTLEGDGLTWNIQVNPITDLLAQHVAAQDLDARISGIYHHKTCPVFMQCTYEGTESSSYTVTGRHDNIDVLIDAINAQISTMLTAVSASKVDSCVVALTADRSRIAVRMRTDAVSAPSEFQIVIGSPLLGYAFDLWRKVSTSNPDTPGNQVQIDSLATATDYMQFFVPEDPTGGSVAGTVSNQMTCLGSPGTTLLKSTDTASPWRIHVDKDLSDQVAAGTFVHIAGIEGFSAGTGRLGPYQATEGGEDTLEVSAQSTTGNTYYIDVVPKKARIAPGLTSWSNGIGFLGSDTEITSIRDYGTGDVTAFRTGITAESVDANWGDTPFITAAGAAPYGDLANWSMSGDPSSAVKNRKYRFTRSKSIGEILREEMKLNGHYLYLDDDFRIAVRKYPQVGANMTSDTSITAGDVRTPDGAGGMWPGWSPQGDGLVNEVEIKTGYNAISDDWEGRSFTVKDVYSIAEHKSRGKGRMSITPFSETTGAPLTGDEAARIARVIMGVMAKDYIQVQVEVPFKFFGLKIGDVVLFSSAQVPGGTGSRGLTDKRALVWRREWSFQRGTGKLTLYIPTTLEGGYTPSAYVTGQTDNGSDNWTLDVDSTDDTNIAWSDNADGKVTDHFAAGDYIKLVKWGDSGETEVTGTVASVDGTNDQIVVDLDATWTPGSDTWVLEWPKDTGSTATTRQQGYTYTSDTGLALVNGGSAWRFV